MTIILPDLPYNYDALEPHISSDTMTVHHDKHHKTYVDKLNAAIKDTDYADMPLNQIVEKSHKDKDQAVFNNAAQAWNHGFYWHCLSATKSKLSDDLETAINDKFGSQARLVKAIQDEGTKHFGSGWVWLVLSGGKLDVISTHDAETPIAMGGDTIPLLTLDVWEHAYYLDRKNERPAYLEAALENIINWDFVSANFDNDIAWEYPTEQTVEMA
jgi:superoxide dismutase, Fe-Mn family